MFENEHNDIKTMFVCPWYGNKVLCPKEALPQSRYYDDDPYMKPIEIYCNRSPVVLIEDGTSICKLIIDLAEPCVEETLNNVGAKIKFRTDFRKE